VTGIRWGRTRHRRTESGPAPRTWYRKQSDGTFFRNCPLIMAERDRATDPRVRDRLSDEWDECFREGVITASEISASDRWIEYDDSREANAQWVEQFLAGRAGVGGGEQ
jgi:hypothetical protein